MAEHFPGIQILVNRFLDIPMKESTEHRIAPTNGNRSQELSNLRLELLRNEVQRLNQEMASLLHWSKETQEELNKARARVEKWNVDYSKSDGITRELWAQVDDLIVAVAAKDSQLAVLKVQPRKAGRCWDPAG